MDSTLSRPPMLPTASYTTMRVASGIGASQTGWVTPDRSPIPPGIPFPVCEAGSLREVRGAPSAKPPSEYGIQRAGALGEEQQVRPGRGLHASPDPSSAPRGKVSPALLLQNFPGKRLQGKSWHLQNVPICPLYFFLQGWEEGLLPSKLAARCSDAFNEIEQTGESWVGSTSVKSSPGSGNEGLLPFRSKTQNPGQRPVLRGDSTGQPSGPGRASFPRSGALGRPERSAGGETTVRACRVSPRRGAGQGRDGGYLGAFPSVPLRSLLPVARPKFMNIHKLGLVSAWLPRPADCAVRV